jgi:hypothetical protein
MPHQQGISTYCHVAVNVAERNLWLDHPKLCQVTAGTTRVVTTHRTSLLSNLQRDASQPQVLELITLPSRVAVFSTEGRPEGVNGCHCTSIHLAFELPANTEERGFGKKVLTGQKVSREAMVTRHNRS